VEILTVSQDRKGILSRKCDFDHAKPTSEEFDKVKSIVQQLEEALKPYPVSAGLAASQIGVSEPIFIFSWDRTLEHLQIVYKPTLAPLSNIKKAGWESCYSVNLDNTGLYKVARIPRYELIRVTFYNEKGEFIQQELQGFAARVFQHEYDHIQGLVNIYHPEASEIKTFTSCKDYEEFMQAVKKDNGMDYKAPVMVEIA
jgi:peptide deformylase